MDKYSVFIQWSEEDNAFVATVPELPGLSALGATPDKATKELSTARMLFLNAFKEKKQSLPEPQLLQDYSGQLRLRLPKFLHANLTNGARREGISLNTYIVSLLSEKNALQELKNDIRQLKNEVAQLRTTTVAFVGASNSGAIGIAVAAGHTIGAIKDTSSGMSLVNAWLDTPPKAISLLKA